jgi:predicted alpha/beta superfamily hydrolase
MRAPEFVRIDIPFSVLLLSIVLPASAQMVNVPSLGGVFSAAGAAAAAAPPLAASALSPSLSIGAPVLAASLPAAPVAFAAAANEASAPAAFVRRHGASAESAHTLTGDVRFIENFRSEALDNSRTVAVFLPPGYDSSNERYPVLYMQDGQNLFDAATAYGGNEWGIDETCQRMMLSGELPPFIVVAVYNTKDRISEYSSVSDAQYGGGNGANYEKFLIKELKPFIDSNLRTLPDAENTGIMGSSMGGLISLDVGLSRPDVFLRIGGPSASLWWSKQELAERLKSSPPAAARARVWLSMGTREGEHPADRVNETVALGQVLVDRGWREGDDLAFRVIEGGAHNERWWRESAPEILKFLFPVGPRP